jgi:hypothetical protein
LEGLAPDEEARAHAAEAPESGAAGAAMTMTILQLLHGLAEEAQVTLCPVLRERLAAAQAELLVLADLAGADLEATCTTCRRRQVELAGVCRACYQRQRRQMLAFQRGGR